MHNIKINHFTNSLGGTGATVFLFNKPFVGSYHIAGNAPATFDLNVLESSASVTHADALCFIGGSAMGLSSIGGIQKYLIQKNRGWPMPHGRVPIVIGAALYDLSYSLPSVPSENDLYLTSHNAQIDLTAEGSVGAGTGATVGKLVPNTLPSKGGFGIGEVLLQDDICVTAYAVVNAVGDIRNEEGEIIAGAKWQDGQFVDQEKIFSAKQLDHSFVSLNTTLIAIFVNAEFSRVELKRIAMMALSGMSRAISPVFTAFDGDIIFCFSSGKKKASEISIGIAATKAVHCAILRAITQANRS